MPNASLPGSAGPPGGALNLCVARRWPAAVKALAMAISTPVMRAPVIRCRAIGCPPSSQTQMVSGTPMALAIASAASRMMRASSSVSRLTVIIRAILHGRGSWHVHPDLARLDPDLIGGNGAAPDGQEALPGADVVHPAVPGTGQPRPPEHSLTERTALVRARAVAGVDLVTDTGQHDRRAPHLYQLAAARREIREGGGPLLGHCLEVFLEHEGAVQTAHVLPAHLRGLAYLVDGFLLSVGGDAVTLDDLVAALAVHLVGLDVDGEELHLVVAEPVVRLQGRQVALVDAGHLGLEADEQARRRDVERPLGSLVAPGGQGARGGQLLRRLHLSTADPAGLGEADQQVDVLDPRFLFHDVLQEEVSGIGIRALGVDGGAPARELRHVLVVLAGPRAQLSARQIPLHPFLREGIHAAVLGGNGALQALAERTLALAHRGLLWVNRITGSANRLGTARQLVYMGTDGTPRRPSG